MQTKWDFAGSTEMWSTSAGGHLMKVVNLTGFTVFCVQFTQTTTSNDLALNLYQYQPFQINK
jgi:hypothetical protein